LTPQRQPRLKRAARYSTASRREKCERFKTSVFNRTVAIYAFMKNKIAVPGLMKSKYSANVVIKKKAVKKS
jgi:hypothetical protein